MLRPPTLLATVLVAMLFWQAATVAAHCLAVASTGGIMEICGPDGLRLVPLPDHAPPQAETVCTACHLLPPLALPQPDGLFVPVLWVLLALTRPTSSAAGHPAARDPPYRPTGPPAFL